MLRSPTATQTGFLVGLALSTIFAGAARCGEGDSLSTRALKRRPLEELMNIDITLVAKRSQRWFEAPAAVYVISDDDIRRSGARSIPEALRLAPTLNVAQIDAKQWAISSRGFNSTTSNKLLVLIDGRSVYTTLYSGVFWDVQDVLLEDVERIEVISGPGGTLWGTNAVNGIINIITKSSRSTDSPTFHAEAGAGMREKFSGAVRYGGDLGSNWSYRAYAKFFDRNETQFAANGLGAKDSWNSVQGGFRTDGELSAGDALTFQGDAYRTRENQPSNAIAVMEGGNFLARWNHTISGISSFTLKSYFDYTHRRMPDVFGEDLRIFDHEFEHRIQCSAHELSWGIEVRHGNSQVLNSASLAFLPDYSGGSRFSGFAQDIIALNDHVNLTVGSKFTKSSNTDFEFQPRVSLGWSPDVREFLWGSVSRAVRTPSRIDRSLYIPGSPPYILVGGTEFESEKLIAFEAGYRNQVSKNLLLDISLFYNLYDDVRSVEPGPPFVIKNGLEAKTYGGEFVLNAQLTGWWRVKAGYSHLQKKVLLKSWSRDSNGGLGEGNDHKHRVVIQSSMDVKQVEIDLYFRFVDKLPNANAFVPAYSTLDCRLGWNPTKNIALSLLFQNIVLPEHVEFGAPASSKQIGREVFGKVSLSL